MEVFPTHWVPKRAAHLLFHRPLQNLLRSHSNAIKGIPDSVFEYVRSDKVEWRHGEIQAFDEHGIRYIPAPHDYSGSHEHLIDVDICILATGYERPSLRFLPEDVFQGLYKPPHWYMQAFPPERMDL